MSRLDDMIARARQLPVNESGAERYITELGRWARRAEPTRSRLPWLAGGFALAAAAAIAIVVLRMDRNEPAGAVRIGERVAVVAEPDTRYRILLAEHDRTEVFVERGTITARLWPGATSHRLSLRAAGVEAIATGTVYALHVDEQGASVHVHEGKVEVTRGEQHAHVEAGGAWPAGASRRGRDAADRLLALATRDAIAVAPLADASPIAEPADDAAAAPGDAVAPRVPTAPTAPIAAVASDAQPSPSLKERWRQARLLRGQGSFDSAIRECIAIADANDPTWSPIALLEAARIELGPRASPEQAVALADRFEAEWPAHQLAPEARELRCRALRQLGRADECKPRQ